MARPPPVHPARPVGAGRTAPVPARATPGCAPCDGGRRQRPGYGKLRSRGLPGDPTCPAVHGAGAAGRETAPSAADGRQVESFRPAAPAVRATSALRPGAHWPPGPGEFTRRGRPRRTWPHCTAGCRLRAHHRPAPTGTDDAPGCAGDCRHRSRWPRRDTATWRELQAPHGLCRVREAALAEVGAAEPRPPQVPPADGRLTALDPTRRPCRPARRRRAPADVRQATAAAGIRRAPPAGSRSATGARPDESGASGARAPRRPGLSADGVGLPRRAQARARRPARSGAGRARSRGRGRGSWVSGV